MGQWRFINKHVRPRSVAAELLDGSFHGSLDAITDSERRPLRPIGTTALDVAARTDVLLSSLVTAPEIRIFHGVRPASGSAPLISHAICVGRRLILVESVAWPPGWYDTETDGRINCDGVYIGQSAGPLVEAVVRWRALLPIGHRVKAVVVVHRSTDGDLRLPASGEIGWVLAEDAVRDLRELLPHRRQTSVRAVAALIAATADWQG